MNISKRTVLMIKMSLLTAIAVVLMYIEFPILPAFAWLKMDLSELPILIGTFAFGPVAGIVMELFKNLLIILVKGSGSGGVGELANFIIGVALIVPAGLIYNRNKTRNYAILGLTAGSVAMAIVGALANYFVFIPLYGLNSNPTTWIMNYIFTGVIPFNLIKAIIISAITLIIYKRVSIIIRGKQDIDINDKDYHKTA